jgi:hypothetical protein
MSAGTLVAAADVRVPLAGYSVVLSVNDTAARFAIPTVLAGKMCSFLIDGTDCDVLAGDSGVAVTYGQASTVDTQVITVNAGSGWHLKDGVPQRLHMPNAKQATHLSVDCKGSGSGKLYIKPE